MRNATLRDIFFYDLFVASEPKGAPAPIVESLIERLIFGWQLGTLETTHWSRRRRLKISLRAADYDPTSRIAWLLICVNDADAGGASFSHLETDTQRDLEKEDGEGRPQTSHLAIVVPPAESTPQKSLVLMEGAPSLSRLRLEAYINFLLRGMRAEKPDDFKYPNPDGSLDRKGLPRLLTFRCEAELKGHISPDFAADLEAGVLTGIQIETKVTAAKGFGESPFFRPSTKTIRLSPRISWKTEKLGAFKDALRLGRTASYETARITFRTPDQVAHTALIDTSDGTTASDGYIRRAQIANEEGFWSDASKLLDNSIQQKMIVLAR